MAGSTICGRGTVAGGSGIVISGRGVETVSGIVVVLDEEVVDVPLGTGSRVVVGVGASVVDVVVVDTCVVGGFEVVVI